MNSALSALAQRTKEPPISWLMKIALERPGLISLAAGFTDHASLPVDATHELLAEILSDPKVARASLQYGSTEGDMRLRRLTAERLREQDQQRKGDIRYSEGRTVITHGSQQLLYLLTEALCDEGDIILVEDPTYFVYLGITESRGVECRGIALESDGISIPALERSLEALAGSGELKRLKFLYMVSYFQNPTAITTSLEKKRAVLDLLRRHEKRAGHPIYLLEDAAYRDLRFAGVDVASALSLDDRERALYAGTYSKPFATGVRVGYGILPPDVFEIVTRIKGNHDFGTANILQQILSHALSSHRYSEHVQRLQKRYSNKAAVFVDAVRRHFPEEVLWDEPKGGLYLWAKLPKRIQTGFKSLLFQAALEANVLYVPGEICYARDYHRRAARNEMRLSFGSATESQLVEGAKRLGKVIARAVAKR